MQGMQRAQGVQEMQGVNQMPEGLRPLPVWGCMGRRTPCTRCRLTIN